MESIFGMDNMAKEVAIKRMINTFALRGFMDRLWNLNFTILYLEMIEPVNSKDVDLS